MLVLDALDKIFKDEDAPPIHTLAIFILFVISAVALYPEVLMTMNAFDYSDYKMYHDITNSLSSAALFLVSIYITGYNIMIINKTFHEEIIGEKTTVLPEIDGKPYRVFLNFFPVQLFWFIIYAIAVLGLAALVFFTLKTQLVFASIPVALIFMFLLPFMSFILAAYAKDFSAKGLFNPFLLFKFINKQSVKKLFGLIIQFAPIWIIVGVFTTLTYQFNIPVKTQMNVTLVDKFFYQKLFVMNAASAYLEIVATFIWSYCIAKVFAQTEKL